MGEGDAEAAVAVPKASSVGVLGWLGFVIVNSAAFGIIGVGSSISWVLGFLLSGAYTVVLIVFAVLLQRRGEQYSQFVNLLWVLACIFLFIDGLYLAINVIGPLDGTDVTNGGGGGGWEPVNNDLSLLLPDGASQALKTWSQETNIDTSPFFASFNGLLFFASPASGTESWNDVLWKTDVATSSKVDPVLSTPRSFVEFNSNLFFDARQDTQTGGGSNEGVWYIAGSAPSGSAQKLFGSSSNSFNVNDLFVDTASSSLYIKTSDYCDNVGYIESVFKSDGTTAGTVDLRTDGCPVVTTTTTSSGDTGSIVRANDAEYWGIMFVAAGPMMGLATYVMFSRQIYGVFANLYGGVFVVFLMIFSLASDDINNLFTFQKWFWTIYSSALYLALLALSVTREKLPEWLEEMKTWAVALAAISFFVVIHIDLEIPFSTKAWAWVVYGLLVLLQFGASVVLQRTTPMVFGALGAFVVAYKVSWETVRLIGGDDWGGLQMLTVFGLMALQGIGIIVLAVVYASKRDSIEAMVQNTFRKCRGEKPLQPDAAEEA